MNQLARNNGFGRSRPHPGAPLAPTTEAFREQLDALLADDGGSEDALNVLLAFYGSRCDHLTELRDLGDALFSALNKDRPVSTVRGRYRDRHVFLRAADRVHLQVDGEAIACLPVDDAIRLATLLHGAPQTRLGTSQAA